MKIEIEEKYTLELVRANPNKLFIFGDNFMRYGKDGQAIIRDEPNSYGICTKKAPLKRKEAYFTDCEIFTNMDIIRLDIDTLLEVWKNESRKILVFPKGGIGLSDMKNKCPHTFNFMNKHLYMVFGFDNEKGVCVNDY